MTRLPITAAPGRAFLATVRSTIAGLLIALAVPGPAPAADDTATPQATDGREAAPDRSQAHAEAQEILPVETARRLHRTLVAQVAAEDWSAAETTLEQVRGTLPAQHVLRLRLTGWYAVQRGLDTAAVETYESLLARLPGDEEAVLNLMHVHLRNGDEVRARRVLERARRAAPGSAVLRRESRRFIE